jgi:thiol-disulfide isomerase/thioredoxin
MSGYRYDTVSETSPSGGRSWLLAILLVGAAAIGFAVLMKQSVQPQRVFSPRVGKQFPALKVEGWLNGPGPTADELAGKVLVVDSWAHWCMPCRMAAPSLIEFERKYRDRDVLFLGLTSDGTESLALSKKFLTETGITWPNGYGAVEPLSALEADSIPIVWIVGRDGRIVDEIIGFDPSHAAVKAGIERALAQQP